MKMSLTTNKSAGIEYMDATETLVKALELAGKLNILNHACEGKVSTFVLDVVDEDVDDALNKYSDLGAYTYEEVADV